MDPSSTNEIIVYGTVWCGDTRRARRFMDENHISYKWVDIDIDLSARKFVESVNHGFRSVPTIIFPDGSKLVEPSIGQLAAKFGIRQI
jgi:glutaredoxin-like protein